MKNHNVKLRIIFIAILFFGVFGLIKNSLSATVTYNMATESNAGMDSCVQWQSAFLLNDGRIASFGTGNHQPEQTNAMRIIDPVTNLGAVSSYDEWPWTQSGGLDTYVSNYDNNPSIYLESDGQYGKMLWVGHGVFDFTPAIKAWTYGNRTPLVNTWDNHVRNSTEIGNVYNPVWAWCSAIDKGVFFGGSAGGSNEGTSLLRVIERDGTGGYTWKITETNMSSEGVLATDRARNEGVCIGPYFYLQGNKYPDGTGTTFQKINVQTLERVANLTSRTRTTGDYFPQAVYDSKRNKIIVIGMKIQEYDIITDTWSDITPVGWPGYTTVRGVYHPINDAIYFSGRPNGSTNWDCMKWHMIKFAGSSVPDTIPPAAPTGLSVN